MVACDAAHHLTRDDVFPTHDIALQQAEEAENARMAEEESWLMLAELEARDAARIDDDWYVRHDDVA